MALAHEHAAMSQPAMFHFADFLPENAQANAARASTIAATVNDSDPPENAE